MANAAYNRFKQGLPDAEYDLIAAAVRAVFVETGAGEYIFDAIHDFLDDVPAGSRILDVGPLTTKSVTNGVFDADDILGIDTSAVSGRVAGAIILYLDIGADAVDLLICYLDTATGLPFTMHGGLLNLRWSNAVDRIFRITG